MSKKIPQLNVINGGKDMLEILNDMIEQVKSGHVEGLVISTIERENPDDKMHVVNNIWAFKSDLNDPWSLMISSIAYTHQCLMDT